MKCKFAGVPNLENVPCKFCLICLSSQWFKIKEKKEDFKQQQQQQQKKKNTWANFRCIPPRKIK